MIALAPADRAKLTAILGMLGSHYDDERAAAARKATEQRYVLKEIAARVLGRPAP